MVQDTGMSIILSQQHLPSPLTADDQCQRLCLDDKHTRQRLLDGFYGASSVERLPAERAIAEQIRTFKKIRLNKGAEAR
jgi:hypothetical protein